MKNTNDHPFAGYKLSQINLLRRKIMENKQEPKISTGFAVHTNLVAGDNGEPLAYNLGDRRIGGETSIMNYLLRSFDNSLSKPDSRVQWDDLYD
jgi:hypothetical protein